MREIIDVSKGAGEPRDLRELDTENYGRCSVKVDRMCDDKIANLK